MTASAPAPLAWSPHFALKIPSREQFAALVAQHGEARAREMLAEIHARREQAIKLEKHDPLRNSLFIPETFAKATHLLTVADELLALGGNREGKTRWAVKHVVEALVTRPGQRWAMFHTTERSSINQQQGKVHEMLPPEWRDLGKEGQNVYVKFSAAGGFGGYQQFILPNDSRGMFFNYSQKPSVLEGYEFDGVWFDELVPLEFIEAMEYRLGQGRRLQIITTFTPVTGYTPVIARYLADAKIIETRPAPLLSPQLVHAPGCPRGHMPYVMGTANGRAHVLFFHNGMNPYGAGKEVATRVFGKRPAEIKIRAYGWAEKGSGQAFPRFDPAVHTLTRAQFNALARKGGTRYCVADPGDAKNWFVKWYFVTTAGHVIIYREWPDQPNHGNWAEPPLTADKIEWRPGAAQRTEGGKGIREYKDLFRHLEGAVWQEGNGTWDESKAEPIARRLIDPRLGGAAVPGQDAGTSIVDLMATPEADGKGRLRWGPMYWDAAPATGVFEGVQLLNARLAYDLDLPLDITNCPKWYVVDDCLQTIRAYNEYTCREEGTYSQKDALKDIVDPDRYFAKADLGYVEPGLFRSRGLCAY
jgi:phage terminase large subunit-like protein